MFAQSIIDSDLFVDMPISSQLLYFHLSMRADDDGFIDKPKNIMRTIGAKDDDMKMLIAKKFIIPFESGVVVIRHWRIHNYIQKDRYKETKYVEEKSQLNVDKSNAYNSLDTECVQLVHEMDTQIRLDKSRLDIDNNIIANKKKFGVMENVYLTEKEYAELSKLNLLSEIDTLSVYIASKGKRYKSHYATILNWDRKKKAEITQKRETGRVAELPEHHTQGYIKEKTDEKIDRAELMKKIKGEM